MDVVELVLKQRELASELTQEFPGFCSIIPGIIFTVFQNRYMIGYILACGLTTLLNSSSFSSMLKSPGDVNGDVIPKAYVNQSNMVRFDKVLAPKYHL